MKSSNKALVGSLIVLGLVIIAVGAFKFSRFGLEGRAGEGKGLDCPFAKGVEQKAWSKYDGTGYAFQYPAEYVLTPATREYPVATLNDLKGKKIMEIWKLSDFPNKERPIGVEIEPGEKPLTQAEMDQIAPKESLALINDKAEYEVDLFYAKTDKAVKATLHEIYGSIKLK